MEQLKVTKGEWQLKKFSYRYYITNGEVSICQTTSIKENQNISVFSEEYEAEEKRCQQEEEANAHLIAASKDLFEALNEAVKEMLLINNKYPDRVSLRINQAQAALNKAQGK